MPQRRLLLLEPSGLTAYRWSGGRVRPDNRFPVGNEGIAAFAHYVRRDRHGVYVLVTDLSDEAFQVESVPFVRGADRAALLQRRLSQYYFGTPYSTAIPLGREAGGRRDEKLLFAALPPPAELEPWLSTLRQEGVQLAALYTVPQAAAALGKQLHLDAGPHLLLTVTPRGVRQTFLEQGQFRLSRLTPLASGSPSEAANVCAVEAGKLYNYLTGQRLIERGARLHTIVLAPATQGAEILAACSARPELALTLPALHDLTRNCAPALPDHQAVDALVLHLLASRPPAQQFAPAEDRHSYRVGQIGFALRGLGMLVLLACALLAVKNAYQVSTLRDQIAESRLDTQADRKRYADAMATLPPLPKSADKLADLAARFADIKRQSPSLATGLAQISAALDGHPEIEIEAIDWRLAEQADAAAPLSPGNAPVAGGLSGLKYILINIDGSLPTAMARDNRQMLAMVDALVERLRSTTGGEVHAAKLPFDAESGKTLRSDDAPTSGVTAAPGFSIRVVQRMP